MNEINGILQRGDIEAFGPIAESEAMTLHALMMASNPPYILIQPNTITAIEKVQDFRNTSQKIPLYFSLDAGPNLHLLYPDSEKESIKKFVREELAPLCENNQWIEDEAGEGPEQL